MTRSPAQPHHLMTDRPAAWWCSKIVIVLCVLAVFGPVVNHDILTFDDRVHVVENAAVAHPSRAGFGAIWSEPYGNLYIPVAYSAWASVVSLSRVIAGDQSLDAAFVHGFSVFLHAVAALLVLSISRRLRVSVLAATTGALVFSLHPLQVESVAWLSEGRGLLAAVGSLLGIWTSVALAQAPDRRASMVWSAAATVAGTLAVLSKPSAAPAVGIAWVIGLAAMPMVSWRRAIGLGLWLSPWAIVSLGALLLARTLQPGTDLPDQVSLWQRPLVAGDALAFWIFKLIWPFGLTPDYARTPARAIASGWTMFAWLLPSALALMAWFFLGRARVRTLVAMSIFVIGVVPVLGLVPFDHQAISTVADRYVYLSMLGLALGTAWALDGIWKRAPKFRGVGISLVLALCLLWGLRSSFQVRHWRSDIALWTHAVKVQPDARTARNNLGDALLQAGRLHEALDEFQAALRIEPRFVLAQANIGWTLMALNQDGPAREALTSALTKAPYNSRALAGLGLLDLRAGNPSLAAITLERAAHAAPRDGATRANLGAAYLQSGDVAQAVMCLRDAVRLDPSRVEAHHNLGLALQASGQPQAAIDAWQSCVARGIAGPPTLNALGDQLVNSGLPEDGRRAFERTIGIDSANAYALNNLGMLAGARGDIHAAAEYFALAVRADPSMDIARTNLAKALELKRRESAPTAP